MKKPTASQLASLGAEQLAGALADLAEPSDEAARLVARLTATPKENVTRFKTALAALRRRKRFIPYGEAASYAAKLRGLLGDLEAGVTDPRAGVELVAAFYRADNSIFDACDDSDGSLGEVFRITARDLFARYAAQCEDKEWVAGIVFALQDRDDYGVRDHLLEVSARYLPEPALRALADRMWTVASKLPASARSFERNWPRQHWFLRVELVARQLNDAALFERARRASTPELGTAACTDIAQAWLDAGQAATALTWMGRIEPEETFQEEKRDRLLSAIHARLGNRDEVERLAWKRFRGGRSLETLDELLQVIGRDRRDGVVADATAEILQTMAFSSGDAAFLAECARVADAARYVIARRTQVNGDDWSRLRPLADAMEAAGEPLAATVICRALLDSILTRGYSGAYGHGARYLERLDRLAAQVAAWGAVAPHAGYVESVRAQHGRKTSFWARYRVR